jgi:alpha-glucosidase
MKETAKEEEIAPAAPPPPASIPYEEAHVSKRFDDVFQDIVPDAVREVSWSDHAYHFRCHNGVSLRIQVLTAGIVRLRYAPDGVFERDFSYAISPDFVAEKVNVTLEERDQEYVLVSEKLQVVVSKPDLKVKFYDLDDRVLSEDEGGYSARRTVMQGWCDVRLEKKWHKKELFMGLGDKACPTNLSGRRFENWCTDSYGFGRESDTLYRAVPFYYAVNQGLAYGIFLDNTFRSYFDFNSTETGVTTFGATGGELNYYFIYGPRPLDVAKAYAQLTGVHELPPLWALGYHQCRWSYYPEARVREVAQMFRDLQIPCDSIYLDIDYMDGFRCFTWDEQHFPNPKRLIDDLRDMGFQTVVMIDPGIKEDPGYAVYDDGLEKDIFVKTSDGLVAKGPVWPGFCAFPDFTDPKARDWWAGLHDEFYGRLGVAGFWNDMNEPAVFHVNHKTLHDHAMHHYDGQPCSHKKAHNIYGQQMLRASWDAYKQIQPEKRPFLLGRANFAGGQRFAALWTGDNLSDWEQLQVANIQCQRLSISGFSFCGTDIGGFTGCTDGELYVRWLQLAVFHPLMRTHSMGQHSSGDSLATEASEVPETTVLAQEPWVFGDKWTPLAKKAIELRYCLLPALYTALWQHSLDGTPVLQHLTFADAAEPRFWEQERDFLFGEHLLVSPVVLPKAARQGVYLPNGTWYYFWTGQPASGEVFLNLMPDQIPFFVREGAVLPIHPIRQWTGEKPVEELTLYAYYKQGQELSHLYEDGGEGYGYRHDDYALHLFETHGEADRFSLRQVIEGRYSPTYTRVLLYLVGFPKFVRACRVDGKEAPIKEIKLRDRSLYTLTLSPGFGEVVWEA